MIAVHAVAVAMDRLDLPLGTARRVECLLLRSHIEELVERIPRDLVPLARRNRVRARLWSTLGQADLDAAARADRERVVRALLGAYSEMSDVLHGRRIDLSPDPVDLHRWAEDVRAGCRRLPPTDDACPFCNGARTGRGGSR